MKTIVVFVIICIFVSPGVVAIALILRFLMDVGPHPDVLAWIAVACATLAVVSVWRWVPYSSREHFTRPSTTSRGRA
jgi:ABC-type sugar transport system permease subunit